MRVGLAQFLCVEDGTAHRDYLPLVDGQGVLPLSFLGGRQSPRSRMNMSAVADEAGAVPARTLTASVMIVKPMQASCVGPVLTRTRLHGYALPDSAAQRSASSRSVSGPLLDEGDLVRRRRVDRPRGSRRLRLAVG